MIKIILAEDHHLVRRGIHSLLEEESDIEIVAEAENGEVAFQLVCDLKPDVLVTDIGMPRLNGIQAAEKIRDYGLETRVVILSLHSDRRLVQQALHFGVRSYVLKDSISDELLCAIKAAARRAIYYSADISDIVMHSLTRTNPFEAADGVNQ